MSPANFRPIRRPIQNQRTHRPTTRNLRRENNIASNKKVKFILKPSDGLPPHDVEVLRILLNAEPLILDANYEPPKGTPSVHSKLGGLYLPLEGLIDVMAEKTRLQKELVKINAEIQTFTFF